MTANSKAYEIWVRENQQWIHEVEWEHGWNKASGRLPLECWDVNLALQYKALFTYSSEDARGKQWVGHAIHYLSKRKGETLQEMIMQDWIAWSR